MTEQKEYIGTGAVSNLKGIVDKLSPRSILVVTGKKSFVDSGAEEAVIPQIQQYDVIKYSDIKENPQLSHVESAMRSLSGKKYDLVIAVGGGSAIDMAKMISVLSAQLGMPSEYIIGNKKIDKKGVPLIAIPTTAGSGAESTCFAVVYVGRSKYSLEHEMLLPDISIVDPTLMLSMPKKVAASSGIDALGQAIESYWSVKSDGVSKEHSKQAIELIFGSLVDSVNLPNIDNRSAMAIGAHLAGKAINITRTTAPHAISYPLTSILGFSHGEGIALALPEVFVFNSRVTEQDVNDPRGIRYVKKSVQEICGLLGANNAEEARGLLISISKRIGMDEVLSKFEKMRSGKIDEIIANVGLDRMKNNPRRINEVDLISILEGIGK